MQRFQWVLYDQCHIDMIETGVTDIVFFLYTQKKFSTPYGDIELNIRSRILEYAIAQSFLDTCKALGYRVHWIEVKSYKDGLCEIKKIYPDTEIIMMRPSEEFLARRIESWKMVEFRKNRQFLIDPEEFQKVFEKTPVMETFYRYMRKSRHLLIEENGEPTGGKWNYDQENRKYDTRHKPSWNWQPQDHTYITQAKKYYNCEQLDCIFPATRTDALSLLSYFLEYHSSLFGNLEDAMYKEDAFVHHSLLSSALNYGLLGPMEVLEAILGWHMPIASQEGFLRQILGWREYMRQFYLAHYEDLYEQNILEHHTRIPQTWWSYDGNTSDAPITHLSCVDTVIKRVQTHHYSHHIERLMVIGNFALLRGYHPLEVNRWFAEMYVDAFEWVVSPNVLAMSQYSDGGRLATKPYISGGNYIEKMSNFCDTCQYSVKEKTCPMTALYWDFVERNTSLFEKGRTPYILSNLKKIDMKKIQNIKNQFIASQKNAE